MHRHSDGGITATVIVPLLHMTRLDIISYCQVVKCVMLEPHCLDDVNIGTISTDVIDGGKLLFTMHYLTICEERGGFENTTTIRFATTIG